jgi:hypothetical protein
MALGRDVTQQQATLDAAKAEIRRLGQLKPVPARIEPVGAGRTFRQRWEELDVQGRNAFLRESEIEVYAEPWADSLPHVLALPKPASDQAVILFGEGMRIVIDLGKLEKLRHQAQNA